MLKKLNLQQVIVYLLAIIVLVNDFQAPKIQAILAACFRDCNVIARGSDRSGK